MTLLNRFLKPGSWPEWSVTLRRSVLVAAIPLAGGAALASDAPLPEERDAGQVSYREGGIGVDEAHAMRTASGEYPLMLTFSEYLDGAHAYTTGVDVSIESRTGATVLDRHSRAPLMLIDLPEGVYEVTASLEGRTQSQTVHVAPERTQRVYFEWKGI